MKLDKLVEHLDFLEGKGYDVQLRPLNMQDDSEAGFRRISLNVPDMPECIGINHTDKIISLPFEDGEVVQATGDLSYKIHDLASELRYYKNNPILKLLQKLKIIPEWKNSVLDQCVDFDKLFHEASCNIS